MATLYGVETKRACVRIRDGQRGAVLDELVYWECRRAGRAGSARGGMGRE